jgi:GNAT superfamily N-acetyltransferase
MNDPLPASSSVAHATTTSAEVHNPIEEQVVLRDGTHAVVRPIHAGDVELERRFIEALSPSSRRFRFLETMSSPSDALLRQLTAIDPSTDAAFVALIADGDQQREIGVARFSARPDGHDCEFAVTVSDAWQRKGLGTVLMKRLIDVAKARGIAAMHSNDSAENTCMRQFADHLGMRHQRDPDDSTLVRYTLDMPSSEVAAAAATAATAAT